MDWSILNLWELARVGDMYALKVNQTSVETHVGKSFEDTNIRLETHVTKKDKLVGYTLRERRTRWRPERLIRPAFLGLFYSDAEVSDNIRKPIVVLYHDHNVRLLSFGKDKNSMDYMLVLRTRSEKT